MMRAAVRREPSGGPCHRRVHAIHGGLPGYLAWLGAQLASAERLHERFYHPAQAAA